MNLVVLDEQLQEVIRPDPITPVGRIREPMCEKEKTQRLSLSGMTATCQPPARRPGDDDQPHSEKQHPARLAQSEIDLSDHHSSCQESDTGNQTETHHE